MKPIHGWLVAGVVLGAHPATMHAESKADAKAGAKKPAIDPKADGLLRKMSSDLSSMKGFRFDSSRVMEVVEKSGEKIQALAQTSVAVQRPNKLRADRVGPRGGGSIYYDGTTFTFYGKRDNFYATAKAPDNLDDTIDWARDQLSIDAPGVDLLYSDPYKVLMEDAVSGRYLGEEMVDGRMCHHLAYRGRETDWQLWVEDGSRALPCRFVITSKNVAGAPQFTVSTSNWKPDETFEIETFVFDPPKGAMKIDFVSVSDEVKKQKQARR
jgi:hypothetical protein